MDEIPRKSHEHGCMCKEDIEILIAIQFLCLHTITFIFAPINSNLHYQGK